MNRFISLVAVVTIFVSVSSCREAEEISAVPETNYEVVAKIDKNSSNISAENSSTNNPNPNLIVEEKDPPPKDKIEW